MAGKDRRGGRSSLQRAVRPLQPPARSLPRWFINIRTVVLQLTVEQQRVALELLEQLVTELRRLLAGCTSAGSAQL